ncbi:hypothetical protein GDO78_022463 [Eleutherodactylus coqui]|uniref:Uncharacterized protein n=1 Tax=Eleutherodactylus coqui TaxID=57060 RepID=A0A8J6E4X4_ELECQ|nr:hypothetical protein GDO78_022463 [Eleutherodactylus coqui]
MKLFQLVENLGVSDIVFNVVCGLLGETLKSLSLTLAGIHLDGLPILG